MSLHRIYGVLSRDAYVARDPGGNYAVHIALRADGIVHADPIVAKRDFGHDTPGALAARSSSMNLRAGCRVYVHCAGFGLGYTHADEAAIRLRGVDQIELLDVPMHAAAARDQATT